MEGLNEALKAFLDESDENLAILEQELLELERDPDNSERISAAFRAIHTIKGTSAFFGLDRLERLTHRAEDLMVLLRKGEARMNLAMAAVLLDMVDTVRTVLLRIRETGDEGEDDHSDLIRRLERLSRDGQDEREPDPAAPIGAEPVADLPESGINDSTIRVDVALLDRLMNMISELVLVRNQLLQQTAGDGERAITNSCQRLNVVTSELQEGLMKARMQPISTLWSLYPRLFHDMERQNGKKLRLQREGGDTELDRTLLQAIKDPLTHLIRNAVDHGIESPEERRAAGKPETGLVQLRATHQSGNVIVEIADDGAGIDVDSLLEKALREGLVTPEQAGRMSERDKLELLFLPGLSTRSQVSNFSGRGVGMDVVKANVERIGGNIEIQTEPGRGTMFRVNIPLTLAIIPALIAACGGQRFAVSQAHLLEIVRPGTGRGNDEIEYVQNAPVYRLRGKLLPLVDLRQVLGMPPANGQNRFILVLRADQLDYGLVVDDVHDTEEIVVKPLGRHFHEIRCFAGATIMGDGHVALILDARATAEHAHVVSAQRDVLGESVVEDGPAADNRSSILLFTPDDGRSRVGIPLPRVARLEEFSPQAIEYSGGEEVVQYREGILPLIRLDRYLCPGVSGDERDSLEVVVHGTAQRPVGLVVGRILDIVDEEIGDLQPSGKHRHLLGSAVIQGRVTDIVDLDTVLEQYVQQPEMAHG